MPKTAKPSIEDRIAARLAAREASKTDTTEQARDEAETSLPALIEIPETIQRIKADLALLEAAAARVFMPAADAGLTIVREGSAVRNILTVLDMVGVTASAVKAQADAVLTPPKTEA